MVGIKFITLDYMQSLFNNLSVLCALIGPCGNLKWVLRVEELYKARAQPGNRMDEHAGGRLNCEAEAKGLAVGC